MLDDFTPIVHRLPGRTVKVWAVADVHIGAKEADVEGFGAFLRKVEADPDSYLMLVGDLLNNGIKDSVTNVYEEVMPPSSQIEVAAELLRPVADRILGCVGGNHELRTRKAVDIDIMHTVMVLLGKGDLYRPNMAFVEVSLMNGGIRDRYALLLTHGKSDAKRKRFQYAVEGVDAVITAHTHDPLVEKPARLVYDSNQKRVTVKPMVSLVATSWLRYGGYAARGMYLPKETSNPQHLVLEYVNSNNRFGRIGVVW